MVINLYAKATVVGRLTRDPELNETKSGKAVLNASLAVNRRFGGDDAVDFFDVTAWEQVAKTVAAHKQKGDLVLVEGDLQTDKFEQNGQNRVKTKIVARNVVFLPSKNDANGENKSAAPGDDGFDDIPF